MSLSRQYIVETIRNIWKKMKNAIPVILFFWVLFYMMLAFFGMSYVMFVSLITVMFQGNYKKRQSMESLMKLVLLQLSLAVLAFIATFHYPISLILNILVPFCLIFLKSSQFNPMGYFSGLMTFIFLQLMPVDFHGFCLQMEAFLYGLLYFMVVIIFYQRRQNPLSEYQTEQKGLLLFSEWLSGELEGMENKENIELLYDLQQNLYQKVYRKHYEKGTKSLNERIHYAFALMYQRAVYFMSSRYQADMLAEEEEKILSRQMADFLKMAGEKGFCEKEQREKLQKEGQKLLCAAEQKEEELYIFYQNFLRPFLSILNKMDNSRYAERKKIRKTSAIPGKHLFTLRADSFEVRFALRMSMVLAITISYSVLSSADHGFWLPLNAFILLRPMYEDSVYRMKTRFMGTAAGCMVMAVLLPLFHGPVWHILFASIVVIGLYTATPGTWQQAVFVTCFSLSITTLALNVTTALELRILYVFLAVIIVLIVNKFFFPTNLRSQFEYNFQLIFHMQHSYLRILENSLTAPMDYDIVCNAQIQYHLLHEQMLDYLKKHDLKENEYYRNLLTISWKMVSEMEQLLVLVNSRRQGNREVKIWKDYILYTDYVLNQVQQMLDIKTEKNIPQIKGEKYQRTIKGEPQLSFLMMRYSRNLSSLYQEVCKKERAIEP